MHVLSISDSSESQVYESESIPFMDSNRASPVYFSSDENFIRVTSPQPGVESDGMVDLVSVKEKNSVESSDHSEYEIVSAHDLLKCDEQEPPNTSDSLTGRRGISKTLSTVGRDGPKKAEREEMREKTVAVPSPMTVLKAGSGCRVTNRTGTENIRRKFYTNLISSRAHERLKSGGQYMLLALPVTGRQ
ncbi:unnamed protein product [Gongylonema pulchrum]|uniref:Uncharacterized protein n=1 Tax=Gongylonema pulchrum TaxID=637853 RepID=A0A3P7M2J4_9BILA|nr:unnamed protein product [Gongylonema pulchrum]